MQDRTGVSARHNALLLAILIPIDNLSVNVIFQQFGSFGYAYCRWNGNRVWLPKEHLPGSAPISPDGSLQELLRVSVEVGWIHAHD